MPGGSLPLVKSFLILALLPLLVCLAASTTGPTTSEAGVCDLKDCATMDLALLQEYVSNLNVSGGPGEGEWPSVQGQPAFGALASDWARLLLLLEGQAEGTELRENLLRLSRVVLAAFFESTETPHWTLAPAEDIASRRTSLAEISEVTTTIPGTEQPAVDQQVANVTSTPVASTAEDGVDGGLGYSAIPIEFATTEGETTWPPTGAAAPEDSGTNEAVHERSREEFLQESLREKKADRRLVEEFFASAEGTDDGLTSADVQEFFEGNATSSFSGEENATALPESTEGPSLHSLSSQELVDGFFADDEMSLGSTGTDISLPATEGLAEEANRTTDRSADPFGLTTSPEDEVDSTTPKEGITSVWTSTQEVVDKFGYPSSEEDDSTATITTTTSMAHSEEATSTPGTVSRSKRRLRRRRADASLEAARRFRAFLGLDSPRPLTERS